MAAGDPAGAIAMFELRDKLILSLYPRTELAKDAKVPHGPPKTGEFSSLSCHHGQEGKENMWPST